MIDFRFSGMDHLGRGRRRRKTSPRLEPLEQRQLLATLQYDADDGLSVFAENIEQTASSGENVIKDIVPIAAQMGHSATSAAVPGTTSTVTIDKSDSSVQLSMKSTYISPNIEDPNIEGISQYAGLDADQSRGQGASILDGADILDFDIDPDSPSTGQFVTVTIKASYTTVYTFLDPITGKQSSQTIVGQPDMEDEQGDILVGYGNFIIKPNPATASFQSATGQMVTIDLDSFVGGYDVNGNGSSQYTTDLELSIQVTTGASIQPMTVTATDNAMSTGFGPYLAGVQLPNTFTITPGAYILGAFEAIQYSFVDTSGSQPVVRQSGYLNQSDSTTWSFSQDMGQLAGSSPFGSYSVDTLKVSLLSEDGQTVESSTFPINYLKSLNYQLTADDPGDGVNVGDLRFIQGISLTPTFTETITNLPSYYANSITGVQIEQIPSGLYGPPVLKTINVRPTAGQNGVSFTFSTDVGNLYAGFDSLNSILADSPILPIFNVEAGQSPTSDSWGHPSVYLTGLPDWISEAGQNIKAAWDADSEQYVISFAMLQGVQDTEESEGTPFGLFDNLDTKFSAGVDMTVTAKLTENPGDALASANDWFAQATILGQPIINKSGSLDSDVQVSATLDPLTLDLDDGINITADPINLVTPNTSLFDVKFGVPDALKNVLSFAVPGVGAASSFLNLSGEFQGILHYVRLGLNLTVEYNSAAGDFEFEPGSRVELDASADVTLQLAAKASLGFFSILTGDDYGAVVAGAVGAEAKATLQFDLNGDVTDPDIDLDHGESSAGVAVATHFVVDLGKINGSGKVQLTNDNIDTSTGLFGLGEPSKYDFDLTGPGTTNSPGLPGVKPSVGNAMSVMGPAPSVVPHALLKSLVAPAPTPTSTLTAEGAVYSPIDSLQFDVNALADHASLTPGHHFLDAVLVGDDGSEVLVSHQDLATLVLQTNANPLGYASGWSTVKLDLSDANLEPAMAYHLVFRLTDDLAGTGEAVEVAIDNIQYGLPSPSLAISSPQGPAGGPIDLSSGSATVTLTNTGTAALEVSSTEIAGSGATFSTAPSSDFVILPGTSTQFVIDRSSASSPVSATLDFTTNDPNEPGVALKLVTSSQQPTTLSAVSGSGTYGGEAGLKSTLTSNGSPLAGQTVKFSLVIGGVSSPIGTAVTNSSGVATLSGAGLAGINAGTYTGAVAASFASSGSYTSSSGSGNLVVSKAVLTVTADDEDMNHGGSLPALLFKVTGLVGADGLSAVTGSPKLTTTASSTSAAGLYPITIAVGTLSAANYTFKTVGGTLTVHPEVVDVLVQWGSRTMSLSGLSRDLPFADITAIDIVFSDNVSVSEADLTLKGLGGKSYSWSGFTYNSSNDEATWSLPTAIGIDSLLLALDGTGANGVRSAGTAIPLAANFGQGFSVLPGDFNGDGVVNSQDTVLVRNEISGIAPLTAFGDLDGNGAVDIQDFLAIQKRLGTHR